MTEAMPMPRPPTMRQTISETTPVARPAPKAEARNSTAPISMTFLRPIWWGSCPANQAPTAQPSRATATENPISTSLSAKSPWIAATAPFTTELSKPKRNPPTAATTVTPTTFAVCSSSCSVVPDTC